LEKNEGSQLHRELPMVGALKQKGMGRAGILTPSHLLVLLEAIFSTKVKKKKKFWTQLNHIQ
jgi:hypothetical protein